VRILTSKEALSELRATGVLEEVRLEDAIDLRAIAISDADGFDDSVRIRRCELEGISASFVQFQKQVTIEACRIAGALFDAAYFLGGLAVAECTFTSRACFQWGGHNRDGTAVRFIDTTFEEFVDFEDCWYEGPFEVRQCIFKQGTNLFGNHGRWNEVRFDVPPIVVGNSGVLDLCDEGGA
jgi:hypothetical protein